MPEKLPPRTNYFYRQFVDAANKNCPHPNDMERFYHFIWTAHIGRTKLEETQLEKMLRTEGFPYNVSGDLSRAYYYGRQLLKNRFSPQARWEESKRT